MLAAARFNLVAATALVVAVAAGACNAFWGLDELRYEAMATGTGSGAATGTGGAAGGVDAAGAAAGSGGGEAGGAGSCCDGGGGDVASGGGGAGPGCPAGSVCRPAPPGVTYLALMEGNACAAGQSATELAHCDNCGCVSDAGKCTVGFEQFEDAACQSGLGHMNVSGAGGICAGLDKANQEKQYAKAESGVIAVSCAPAKSLADPLPLLACTRATLGPCSDGVCVALDLPCLTVAADVACPAQYALVRGVLPAAAKSCKCGCVNVGACPGAQVKLALSVDCSLGKEQLPVDGACHKSALPKIGSVWIDPGPLQTPCASASKEQGAMNLCCLPGG
ncbi:MAG: hypothetical protein HY744_30135 [Deltaproteobacteria bacterium]|nr:hypothetical protein [Deltaproteobacteria bacterium]